MLRKLLSVHAPFRHIPTRPVLFVPGWGFDGRVLCLAETALPWLAPVGWLDPSTFGSDLLAWLDENRVARLDLIGWSMGANCALDFACRHPERISSLTLLSMRQHWPAAEIEEIGAALHDNPQEFLVSFYRKCFLGYKQAYGHFVRQLQDAYLRTADVTSLQKGLDYLASFRFPPPPACETQCIHGTHDIVAPLAEAARLPGAGEIVLQYAGHPVFLDKEFRRPARQRKEVVRRRFCKAAVTYDAHADVQKEVAKRLVADLAPEVPAASVLELGCGTGNYTMLLADRYRKAHIFALDFSEEMVRIARQKAGASERMDFVCCDAEVFLAQGPARFELITANATMQWFDDLDAAVGNIKKMLTAAGVFWGSLFGPQTLQELEQGLQHVMQGKVHVSSSRFWTEEEIAELFGRHFGTVHVEEWRTTRHYGSLREMLHHFKKTGTGGWHPGAPVLTRQQLAGLDAWFLEKVGGYRATYQVFLMRCG